MKWVYIQTGTIDPRLMEILEEHRLVEEKTHMRTRVVMEFDTVVYRNIDAPIGNRQKNTHKKCGTSCMPS